MITQLKHAVLLALLFAPSTQYAMDPEETEQEKHDQYMVVMEKGYAEDYETLYKDWSAENPLDLKTWLRTYPAYTLDRGKDVCTPFKLIRQLLTDHTATEERVVLPTAASFNTRLGILLTFPEPQPPTIFLSTQFPQDRGRLPSPILIAGRKNIKKYRTKSREAY